MSYPYFTNPDNYEKSGENERGNILHRLFSPSERYVIDFAETFKADGWEQYDTDQDAPYFGVWVNRRKLMTLNYAEGDWTLVTCPGSEHFDAEIADANEFYGEGFICKVIDDNGDMTIYCQDRNKF